MRTTSTVTQGLLVLDAASRSRFAAFVRQYEGVMYAMALKLCGNASDASDLVQDTLETALRHFAQLETGGRERAWLARVMRNRFIDICRRARSEPIDEKVLQDATAEPYEEPPWTRITPEQHRGAVHQLSDTLRQVYELKVLDGLSYQEIGRRLGIGTITVGTRLSRARRMLRMMLAEAVGEA